MTNFKMRVWDNITQQYLNTVKLSKRSKIQYLADNELNQAVLQISIDDDLVTEKQSPYKCPTTQQTLFEGDLLAREEHVQMYGTDLDKWCEDIGTIEFRQDYGGFYVGETPLWLWLDGGESSDGAFCRPERKNIRKVGNVHENNDIIKNYKQQLEAISN